MKPCVWGGFMPYHEVCDNHTMPVVTTFYSLYGNIYTIYSLIIKNYFNNVKNLLLHPSRYFMGVNGEKKSLQDYQLFHNRY